MQLLGSSRQSWIEGNYANECLLWYHPPTGFSPICSIGPAGPSSGLVSLAKKNPLSSTRIITGN